MVRILTSSSREKKNYAGTRPLRELKEPKEGDGPSGKRRKRRLPMGDERH